MSTEHEENLRDLAAMFAMCGLIMRGEKNEFLMEMSYDYAEDFMAARANHPERGIAAIKRSRRKKEA
jgi:hypothetical protein